VAVVTVLARTAVVGVPTILFAVFGGPRSSASR